MLLNFVKKLFKMVPRSSSSYALIISLIIAIKCEPPPFGDDGPPEYSEQQNHRHHNPYESSHDQGKFDYGHGFGLGHEPSGYSDSGDDNSIYEQSYSPSYDYHSDGYGSNYENNYNNHGPSYVPKKHTIKQYSHSNPNKKYSNLYSGHKGYGQYGDGMTATQSANYGGDDEGSSSSSSTKKGGNSHGHHVHKVQAEKDEKGGETVSYESSGYHTKGHSSHGDDGHGHKETSHGHGGGGGYHGGGGHGGHGGHGHGGHYGLPEIAHGHYGGVKIKNILHRESESHARIRRGGIFPVLSD